MYKLNCKKRIRVFFFEMVLEAIFAIWGLYVGSVNRQKYLNLKFQYQNFYCKI
jgi:hypothetical protein